MIHVLLLSMYNTLWPLWNYSLLGCEVRGKAVGLENLILQTLTVGECASWCVRQWNKQGQKIPTCAWSHHSSSLFGLCSQTGCDVCERYGLEVRGSVFRIDSQDKNGDDFPGISSLSWSAWQPTKLAAFQCPVILTLHNLRLWIVFPLLPLSCHSVNGKENPATHCRRKHNVLQSSPQS